MGIADVDCTTEGKPICDSNGVKGFPTIKFGDPTDLQDYNGARTYEGLKKFIDEELKPTCSPSNIDLCDDEKKKEIADLMALDDATKFVQTMRRVPYFFEKNGLTRPA